MKAPTPFLPRSVEFAKTLATMITALGVILGLLWWLFQPHITQMIRQAIPPQDVPTREEMQLLRTQVDLLASNQAKIRTQAAAIKESLVKQEANLRVLIFIARGKDGFDSAPSPTIPDVE